MSAFFRALLVLVLVAGVLGFGAMGLCGGYFTLSIVPELFRPGAGAGGLAFLVLSLPCLMGGLFMVWICIGQIGRVLGKPQDKEDAS
jgi:TRAP-type C4-dicarboxylate transport system permease small subunit